MSGTETNGEAREYRFENEDPDARYDDQCGVEVLDTLGDEHTRTVLAALNREPHSVKELVETCDLSQPTIYRRLQLLQEHDLITEWPTITDAGTQCRVYESTFDRTVVALTDDEYTVRIHRREHPPTGSPERRPHDF